MQTMENNMKLSNLVKEMIKNHRIREKDCQ